MNTAHILLGFHWTKSVGPTAHTGSWKPVPPRSAKRGVLSLDYQGNRLNKSFLPQKPGSQKSLHPLNTSCLPYGSSPHTRNLLLVTISPCYHFLHSWDVSSSSFSILWHFRSQQPAPPISPGERLRAYSGSELRINFNSVLSPGPVRFPLEVPSLLPDR